MFSFNQFCTVQVQDQMSYSVSSTSTAEVEETKPVTNMRVKSFKNTRIFMTTLLPILPFIFIFVFILTLFFSNLRINSGINRAFKRPPNTIVFKIDTKEKIISSDHIPVVKYDHSRKVHTHVDTEQFFSQEEIRTIQADIVRYNNNLPSTEVKDDEIDRIVHNYDHDTLSPFDSYN